MAKRKGSTALAPRVQVVQVPARRAPGRLRRAAGHVRRHAKKGSMALAKGVYEEKLAIASIGGAGVVGFLDGAGHLDFVPDFGVGRVPTLAIGAYALGRAFKSQKLRHAGLGLAAAAAFAFGQDTGKKHK